MTTVGYGDVGAASKSEKEIRLYVMIIGCIYWSAMCASITELIIFDNEDTQELKSRTMMISKITLKYNLKNDSRKCINMLANSI